MFQRKEQILSALEALGRRLALMQTEPRGVLVCGGAALNCQGLLSRATIDIDVLALTSQAQPPALIADDLTPDLLQAVQRVATELRLPADWLNAKANLVKTQWGLPPGILQRARRQEFGPCLTALFLHRQDLAALKLIGSLDKDPAEAFRHFRDLMEIEPTREEVEFCVAWILDRPTSVEFRQKLREVAERLGFDKLPALKNTARNQASPALRKPASRRGKRRK